MKRIHWQEFEYFHDHWRNRILLMATHIEPGQVIADLGCGKQWLKDYIDDTCDYIPVDLVRRCDQTLVCNFNEYCFPNIYVDVSFLSGVLEYIYDVDWFIEQLAGHTKNKIIVSYCCFDERTSNRHDRKINKWVNDLSHEDLVNKFEAFGAKLETHFVAEGNDVFVFLPPVRAQPYGVLIYPSSIINLGDYTQAAAILAITQRPDDAIFLHREALHDYRGKPLPVVCNGWFSHQPIRPPATALTLCYVSLHIARHAQPAFAHAAMQQHLAACAPIGCRDPSTAAFVRGLGIDAYDSSCVTLALGEALAEASAQFPRQREQVYLVDPPVITPANWVDRLVALARGVLHPLLIHAAWPMAAQQGPAWRKLKFAMLFASQYAPLIKALGRRHVVIQTQFVAMKPGQSTCRDLFARIRSDLQAYRDAQAVVTARIHVGLPATGIGARVIFLRDSTLCAQETDRISGHTALFSKTFELPDNKLPLPELLLAIKAPSSAQNAQPSDHAEITERLKATIRRFLDLPNTVES